MKSFFLVHMFTAMLAALSLPRLASAQGGDLTDKGTPANVNERRPNLPAVARDTAAGRFGDKSQLTISSDAGLAIESRSVSDIDGSTTHVHG